MDFVSLASSSKGNCYILSDGTTRIMIECGLSEREIKKRLHAANICALSDISAVLISHEHKDHSKSASQMLNTGISVYTSEGTADALCDKRFDIISAREEFSVGTFDILPFETYHNAAEPLGFLIRSRSTGERFLFAIDTVNMPYIVPNLDYIAIECNYVASELARHTQIVERVKKHVENAHFELSMVTKYLSKLDLSGVRQIWLMHLSATHSNEAVILQTFQEQFPHINIEICAE
jgi:phosphoribosyl 1,2-cyclic phosphodiesterase